jgi:hypothetical protein
MFDYHNAVIYSQARKEQLLRECQIAQLLAKPSRQKYQMASRVAASMGNMLIRLGTRLKAPYEAAREAPEPSTILNYQGQR